MLKNTMLISANFKELVPFILNHKIYDGDHSNP